MHMHMPLTRDLFISLHLFKVTRNCSPKKRKKKDKGIYHLVLVELKKAGLLSYPTPSITKWPHLSRCRYPSRFWVMLNTTLGGKPKKRSILWHI
jgi:hypothetical protein